MCTTSYASVPRSAQGLDQQVDLALDFASTNARKATSKRRPRARRSSSSRFRRCVGIHLYCAAAAALTHAAAAVAAATQAAAAAAGPTPAHAAVNHCRLCSRLHSLYCSGADNAMSPQPSPDPFTSPQPSPRALTPSQSLAAAARARNHAFVARSERGREAHLEVGAALAPAEAIAAGPVRPPRVERCLSAACALASRRLRGRELP
jgi:hypothetical protein